MMKMNAVHLELLVYLYLLVGTPPALVAATVGLSSTVQTTANGTRCQEAFDC